MQPTASNIPTTNNKHQLKWNTHEKPQTYWIRNKLIEISDSIWYSTDYVFGGMVEYCLKTNTVKQVIPYPQNDNIKPYFHCLCKYKNLIYIIDTFKNCEIIEFNPSSKTFTKKIKTDNIGACPSAIAINDEIHIYNGGNNSDSAYIYSPKSNTIRKTDDQLSRTTENVCLLNYRSQLLRFAGGINRFLKGTNNTDIVSGYVRWFKSITKLSDVPTNIIAVILRFYSDDTLSWTRLADKVALSLKERLWVYCL